jgi:hypothetical protein
VSQEAPLLVGQVGTEVEQRRAQLGGRSGEAAAQRAMLAHVLGEDRPQDLLLEPVVSLERRAQGGDLVDERRELAAAGIDAIGQPFAPVHPGAENLVLSYELVEGLALAGHARVPSKLHAVANLAVYDAP